MRNPRAEAPDPPKFKLSSQETAEDEAARHFLLSKDEHPWQLSAVSSDGSYFLERQL